MLIDDDVSLLDLLVCLMRRMGHQASGYSDPMQALSKLAWDTDLVISDVSMSGLDGFDVAERVQTMLGTHFPKTLLVSGGGHQVRLERCPPSLVIGLLPKPFTVTSLSPLISLLAQTRSQCPGTQGLYCSHAAKDPGKRRPVYAGQGRICYTSDYAKCPYYNLECGQALRLFIQRGCPS